MERILYIPFDHLHAQYGVLKTANPKQDLIVLVESQRMTSGRPWHPERLFFLISSARHFAAELKGVGFKVEYLKAKTTVDGLKQIKKQHGDFPIHCTEPSSFKQFSALQKFGVVFHANDFFLTPRELFAQWAKS